MRWSPLPSIGNNVSSAILFEDQTSAIDTIAPLRIRRNILAAYVLDGKDNVFARYVATGQDQQFSSFEEPLADANSDNRRTTIQKLTDDNGNIFSLRDLSSLALAIHDDHQRIGTLILFADNRLLFGKLLTTLGTAFLITIGSFGLAWLISSRLQKVISVR